MSLSFRFYLKVISDKLLSHRAGGKLFHAACPQKVFGWPIPLFR